MKSGAMAVLFGMGVVLAAPPAGAQPAPGSAAGSSPSADRPPPSADSDDAVRDQARTLFEQGMTAYEAGDVAGAAELFQQSVDLRPNATALYNLAMCRRELGQKELAVAAFQHYMDLRGTELPAEERSEIEAMVAELGGTLQPAPATTATSAATSTTTPEPAGNDGVEQVWFWTMAGLAVAAGVGAGITGGLALSTHDDFTGGGRTDAELHDTGETLQLTTNVLAGVAGAAAVAALVLVFFTDFGAEQPEQDDEDATVAAWPGGLVVTW